MPRKAARSLDEPTAVASVTVPRYAVPLVLGRGALREIANATGARLRAEAWREPCVVEASGERLAVDAAVEELQRLARPPRRRVHVPPSAIQSVLRGLADVEVETGARLRLELRADGSAERAPPRCFVEVVGERGVSEPAVESLMALASGQPHLRLAAPAPASPRAARRSRSRSRPRSAAGAPRPPAPANPGAEFPWAWTATIRGVRRAAAEDVELPVLEDLVHARQKRRSASPCGSEPRPKLPTRHGAGPLACEVPERLAVERSCGVPWSWTVPLNILSPPPPEPDSAGKGNAWVGGGSGPVSACRSLDEVFLRQGAKVEAPPSQAPCRQGAEPQGPLLPEVEPEHDSEVLSALARGLRLSPISTPARRRARVAPAEPQAQRGPRWGGEAAA